MELIVFLVIKGLTGKGCGVFIDFFIGNDNI